MYVYVCIAVYLHVQTYMFINLGDIYFYFPCFSAELIKTHCLPLKCMRQAGHDENHPDKNSISSQVTTLEFSEGTAKERRNE